MFQEDDNKSNEIRQLILTKTPQLDSYVNLLRNAMKLSVESAIQGIVALIGLKYWLEKLCQIGTIRHTSELEEAMRQYTNSDLGVSAGAKDGTMPVSVIFIKNFLDEFRALNFAIMDSGDIGFFMDTFLKRYFKGDLERLRVPTPIQNFLIGCLAPQKGESVLDPCCGVGDLLIGAMRYVGTRLMAAGIDSRRIASRMFLTRIALEYGADKSLGLPFRDNSLSHWREEGFFDIAMCWPTIGRKLPPMDIKFGIPPKIAQMSEIQALLQCLVDTKPGGRIGIILPDVLIESDSFGVFRQWFESQADLVFSYAFDKQQMNFSFPSSRVSGLVFIKKDIGLHIGGEVVMAADEPLGTAVAAFDAFRKDRKIW